MYAAIDESFFHFIQTLYADFDVFMWHFLLEFVVCKCFQFQYEQKI